MGLLEHQKDEMLYTLRNLFFCTFNYEFTNKNAYFKKGLAYANVANLTVIYMHIRAITIVYTLANCQVACANITQNKN